MRYIIAFLTLTLVAFTLVAAEDNELRCYRKNKMTHLAIQNFCWGQEIRVPSRKAADGRRDGNAWVRIQSDCAPNTWVPAVYCFQQMLDICASGSGQGYGSRKYGKNGCQKFSIGPSDSGIKIRPKKGGKRKAKRDIAADENLPLHDESNFFAERAEM